MEGACLTDCFGKLFRPEIYVWFFRAKLSTFGVNRLASVSTFRDIASMKTSLLTKNWLLLPSLVVLVTVGCQTKSTTESGSTDSIAADETAAQVDRVQPDTLVQAAAAASTSSSATTTPGNADLMRQWVGTYAGTLPCPDCQGIKTSLVLNPDGTYSMQEDYLGKDENKPKSSGGQWKTSADGATLELDYTKRDETVRFRQAEGNSIKMLGRDGAEIASKLNYSLTKQ